MNKLKYEIKLMGGVFFVPFIVLTMVLLYSFLVKNSEYSIELSFSVFQNIIPLFAGWWSILSLSEYLGEECGDLYYTYNISKNRLGLFKNLRYFILYILLSFVILILSMKIIGYIEYKTVLQIILMQALLYNSISFLAMNLIKDTGWTIFINISLFVGVYFTKGYILGRLNYYIPNYTALDKGLISSISVNVILISIVLYRIGSLLFKRKA